jgi:hypothetical protein
LQPIGGEVNGNAWWRLCGNFGTIKDWMGRSHFKMRSIKNVGTETGLHVLAYNLKRAIALLGAPGLIEAMKA